MRSPLLLGLKVSPKVVQNIAQRAPHAKIYETTKIGNLAGIPLERPSCFFKISFDLSSVVVHRNRVNLMLIFHNFSSPFQRRYLLAKTFSGSKRSSGNPRFWLEYLPVFRKSPSGLRIGRFLSQTCLEFCVLRWSKAYLWKLCKLQNSPFSGTIPSVGNLRTFPKII